MFQDSKFRYLILLHKRSFEHPVSFFSSLLNYYNCIPFLMSYYFSHLYISASSPSLSLSHSLHINFLMVLLNLLSSYFWQMLYMRFPIIGFYYHNVLDGHKHFGNPTPFNVSSIHDHMITLACCCFSARYFHCNAIQL